MSIESPPSKRIDLKNWKTWVIGLIASGYVGSPFIIFDMISDPNKAIQTVIQGQNLEQSCNVKYAIWLDKIEQLEEERDKLIDECGHKIKVKEIDCD